MSEVLAHRPHPPLKPRSGLLPPSRKRASMLRSELNMGATGEGDPVNEQEPSSMLENASVNVTVPQQIINEDPVTFDESYIKEDAIMSIHKYFDASNFTQSIKEKIIYYGTIEKEKFNKALLIFNKRQNKNKDIYIFDLYLVKGNNYNSSYIIKTDDYIRKLGKGLASAGYIEPLNEYPKRGRLCIDDYKIIYETKSFKELLKLKDEQYFAAIVYDAIPSERPLLAIYQQNDYYEHSKIKYRFDSVLPKIDEDTILQKIDIPDRDTIAPHITLNIKQGGGYIPKKSKGRSKAKKAKRTQKKRKTKSKTKRTKTSRKC